MKTAVVYDKWLAGLGGGEVVACNMARVLKDMGYSVTLMSQTKVKPEIIMKALGINVKDIRLKIIKDDEKLLKELCKDKDLFIIGGASIYKQTIDQAGRLYITQIDEEVEGDAFFPEIDPAKWQKTSEEKHKGFSFCVYERKT